MIKNNLPDKLGNPDSLKKQSQQFESFSTNSTYSTKLFNLFL